MKTLLFTTFIFFSINAFATFMPDCPYGQSRIYTPSGDLVCGVPPTVQGGAIYETSSSISYCPNGDYVQGPNGTIVCASDANQGQNAYCPSGQYITNHMGQYVCQNNIPYPGPQNCVACQQKFYNQYYGPYSPYPMPQQTRPSYPFYTGQNTPWWGQQGPMYYNNFNYPGPWTQGGQGIQPHHYPGGGGGVAAKPNVYIQNASAEKKVEVSFAKEQINEMLVTTPSLDSDNKWKSTLTKSDKFLVNGIEYDYLFYDLRYDHKKLQYKHGFCSDRKSIINYMLNDLKELNYSEIAMKDFDEHWNLKIPKIKYYCLYPQYNLQLDKAYPITIRPQLAITRALYLVIPHHDMPKVRDGQFPPLPVGKPQLVRPKVLGADKEVIKEWGVSFLMENIIK